MKHILIVGDRGVGKSTLIRRVLAHLNRPVYGFETKKETDLAVDGRAPVYIYPVGERSQSGDNLVGWSAPTGMERFPAAFDHFAPKLQSLPQNGIILMDELGVMESDALAFQKAVLALLDGFTPVIAAVKPKQTPFLEAVRSHPNCAVFTITRDTRDELLPQVLELLESEVP